LSDAALRYWRRFAGRRGFGVESSVGKDTIRFSGVGQAEDGYVHEDVDDLEEGEGLFHQACAWCRQRRAKYMDGY
jgi:hypothetical protein